MDKIIIACDSAAYNLKKRIINHLIENNIPYHDFETELGVSALYPDVANSVAKAVAKGEYQRGILLCGTGIGMSICANKVPGIRAAVCHDGFSAERSRKSNDAQIMCLGERVIGSELAVHLVDIWLGANFSGGGSLSKVERINELESQIHK